jgi:hypothetical protein
MKDKKIDTELAEEGEVIEAEKIETDNEPDVKNTADKTIEELEAMISPRHRAFCKYYASHEEVL